MSNSLDHRSDSTIGIHTAQKMHGVALGFPRIKEKKRSFASSLVGWLVGWLVEWLVRSLMCLSVGLYVVCSGVVFVVVGGGGGPVVVVVVVVVVVGRSILGRSVGCLEYFGWFVLLIS